MHNKDGVVYIRSDEHQAFVEISSHELEEVYPSLIHMVPVEVLLPLLTSLASSTHLLLKQGKRMATGVS